MRLIPMIGRTFNQLTVISRAKNMKGQTAWNCACDCGGARVVNGYSLRAMEVEHCKNHLHLSQTPNAGRNRAQRKFPLFGICECGRRATDRHHKDGNPLNNVPENIAYLCRLCHMIEDGRLPALIKRGTASTGQRTLKPCSHCIRLVNPLRHGRCAACSEYFRRHGIERPLEPRRAKILGKTSKPCQHCGRQANPLRHGFCSACDQYRRNHDHLRPLV
jgi:hypothetical protein